MSMEYGLKQSLPPIKNLFLSLIDRSRVEQDAPYLQILLLDEKDELLVQVAAPGSPGLPARENKKYASHAHPRGMVFAEGPDKSILIMTSYFFKGRYSGRILASIDRNYVTEQVVKPGMSSGLDNQSRNKREGRFHSRRDFRFIRFPRLLNDQPLRFQERQLGEKARDMIAIASVVKETPFILISRARLNHSWADLIREDFSPAWAFSRW